MNETQSFGDWLHAELVHRGWSQAHLARRANTSRSTINDLVKKRRPPGTDICIRIAQALNYPADDVLRIAGHLPPAGNHVTDLSLAELLEVARQLNVDDRAELLQIAWLKLRRQEDKADASPAPTSAETWRPV